MKRLAFALLLLFAISPAIHADDASKQAKVEELIKLTKVDQLITQMTGQMTTRLKTMAAQQNARQKFTPAQEKLVNDYIDQVQGITQGAVAWDKIKPVLVQVYTETYTDQELDGILTFYRSPAGQALVAKSPQLMNRTVELVQQKMTTVQPQLQQANEDFSRKMKELSAAPASSSPSSAPAPAAKP